MNAFTIKDLEILSGIKAHTIRVWEQRYSFLKPQRTDTNIRYYTNDELKKVLNIALLNKYGYKISHLDRMSIQEVQERIVALPNGNAMNEKIINDLINNMVDLELDEFEMRLDEFIAAKGIEKTIITIVFPFLERIGILWVTNSINPAQEHLVTNIIRQKLLVGIEGATNRFKTGKSVLLFLPEGEHHEMGLLFMYFILKSRGVKVLYLGANVPLKDVEYVATLKSPSSIYCHLTAVANNFNLERLLNNLHFRLPQMEAVFTGYPTSIYKKKLPPNISFKKSLAEVTEYLSQPA